MTRPEKYASSPKKAIPAKGLASDADTGTVELKAGVSDDDDDDDEDAVSALLCVLCRVCTCSIAFHEAAVKNVGGAAVWKYSAVRMELVALKALWQPSSPTATLVRTPARWNQCGRCLDHRVSGLAASGIVRLGGWSVCLRSRSVRCCIAVLVLVRNNDQ